MEEIPILILLLFLSGFFSGAEIALFSLGPEKIQALKNKAQTAREKKRAARLELVKSDVDKLLVTILIGNNVVNVAASSIATVVALKLGEQFGLGENASLVIGIVTGVMTFLILVFGEIIPKVFAHKYALKFSLWVAPVIQFLSWILWPIVAPISFLSKKFAGKKEKTHGLSEEELKAALELSENEGRIEKDEKELFERVLEFDQHKVETIMTPRSKIFSLPDNMSTMEALEEIKEANFSRIPVYHEEIDNIIGILRVQSLVEEFLKEGFREKNLANLSLMAPMKIPLTMKIDTLLKKFQEE
jgi:CBS domain containing-hemolysin-like protein